MAVSIRRRLSQTSRISIRYLGPCFLLAGIVCVAQPPDGPGGPNGRRGPKGPPPFPLMEALDADRDGEISVSEIAGASKALATLDEDGDGRLSRAEFQPQFGRLRPGGVPESERRNRSGRGRSRSRADSPPSPEKMIKRLMNLDENGDKEISEAEMLERPRRMFTRADLDKSGSISKEEIEKMAEKMGKRNRGSQRSGRPPRPESTEGQEHSESL